MSSKTKLVFELLLLLLLLIFTVSPSAAPDNISHNTIQSSYKSAGNYSHNSIGLEGTANIESEISLQSYQNFDRTLNVTIQPTKTCPLMLILMKTLKTINNL